jgi:flagellar basal-body rod modification protein FlgD
MSRVESLNFSSPSSAGGKRVNDLEDLDINHFLQLMITELTNQDPLNPMDNTQLVQQIGHIREIAATNQLSDTLASLHVGQSLTTASSLLGKQVTALHADGRDVTGIAERVSVEVDSEDNNKRSYRVHIGDQVVDLKNVRGVKE